MAIQLRRGNEADLDISQLRPGEVAVCLDSGKMIVKLSGSNYLTLTDTDAIQEIVAGKAAAVHTHTKSQITDLANATAETDGSMSSADKRKLDDIEAESTKGLIRTPLYEGGAYNLASQTLPLSESIEGHKLIIIRYQAGWYNGNRIWAELPFTTIGAGAYIMLPMYETNAAGSTTPTINVSIVQVASDGLSLIPAYASATTNINRVYAYD